VRAAGTVVLSRCTGDTSFLYLVAWVVTSRCPNWCSTGDE